eukprot:10774219-Heterocapsa_arctica.AAC.1
MSDPEPTPTSEAGSHRQDRGSDGLHTPQLRWPPRQSTAGKAQGTPTSKQRLRDSNALHKNAKCTTPTQTATLGRGSRGRGAVFPGALPVSVPP